MALLPENATEMKHKKLLEFRSIHYAILSHLLYFRRFFCIKAFQHHSQMVFTVSIVMIILYVLCGITRLAWFNILANAGSKTTYYQGVPVTYISFVVPVFYVGIKEFPS